MISKSTKKLTPSFVPSQARISHPSHDENFLRKSSFMCEDHPNLHLINLGNCVKYVGNILLIWYLLFVTFTKPRNVCFSKFTASTYSQPISYPAQIFWLERYISFSLRVHFWMQLPFKQRLSYMETSNTDVCIYNLLSATNLIFPPGNSPEIQPLFNKE